MNVITVVDEAMARFGVRRGLVIFGCVVIGHDGRHASSPGSVSGEGAGASSHRRCGGEDVADVVTTDSLWRKTGTSDNNGQCRHSRPTDAPSSSPLWHGDQAAAAEVPQPPPNEERLPAGRVPLSRRQPLLRVSVSRWVAPHDRVALSRPSRTVPLWCGSAMPAGRGPPTRD